MALKADFSFEKATDLTDVSANFTLSSDQARYGGYSLKFAGTDDEIDLMIHDSTFINYGLIGLFVFTGTDPGAGEYILAGPMVRAKEGATEWGYGIGAVLHRDENDIKFKIVSLNSDSTVMTTDETKTVTLTDDTWYYITIQFEVYEGNIYIVAKLLDDEDGTVISELNHNYGDDTTRGLNCGGIFQRNTTNIYVDNLVVKQ
jgi:hypothetical protein